MKLHDLTNRSPISEIAEHFAFVISANARLYIQEITTASCIERVELALNLLCAEIEGHRRSLFKLSQFQPLAAPGRARVVFPGDSSPSS